MSKSTLNEDFHDSAKLHVTGRAIYVDDIPVPSNCLHILLGMSRIANGKIMEMELSDCLLYTSPSPRDLSTSRMPSSA